MAEIHQLHPSADQLIYSFGSHAPLLRVAPGAIIELTTEDCFGGKVRTVDDLPSRVCQFPYLNPVTGPIHVEGAEPGDALAVHFADIQPLRDWAVSTTFPHFGALTTTGSTAMLHDALEERVWLYGIDRDSGTCRYSARNSDYVVDLPLDPFHGTVGVAPGAGEQIMSITPSAHGGNMDTPETRTGTTLYLPVNVPGALLAIGDGHCRQGEGEVCGTAVESAMRTTVVVDVIKGAGLHWPRPSAGQPGRTGSSGQRRRHQLHDGGQAAHLGAGRCGHLRRHPRATANGRPRPRQAPLTSTGSGG